MKPSTETASEVKTLSMATDARAARAGRLERIVHIACRAKT